MGILDFFKKKDASRDNPSTTQSKEKKVLLLKKDYQDGKILLTFSTKKGDVVVKAESVTSPSGVKGVLYDCYIVAISQWQLQSLEEPEFVKDITEVISLLDKGYSKDDVMKQLIKDHINKYGKLVDSDLCTFISELYLALTAFDGHCDRDILLKNMMKVAEQNYADKMYLTKYRMSGFGLEPYLVPFNRG